MKTQEVTAINPASQIGGFYCLSESFMLKQGLLLFLGNVQGNIHLMRFNQAANSITSVRNYGRYY